MLSWPFLSERSLLSVGSKGSVLSIGSKGHCRTGPETGRREVQMPGTTLDGQPFSPHQARD